MLRSLVFWRACTSFAFLLHDDGSLWSRCCTESWVSDEAGATARTDIGAEDDTVAVAVGHGHGRPKREIKLKDALLERMSQHCLHLDCCESKPSVSLLLLLTLWRMSAHRALPV